MPTTDERLALIRLKIERAIKHIDDLAVVCKGFVDTTPYSLSRKIDPKTGYHHFSIATIDTPPVDVALIAGDAIHNLRSALDHLACQLVFANGQVPCRQTCFPIFDSAAKYKSMDKRKVKGMSKAAIDAIDAAKPYAGGDEPLAVLHELDISDKHHALLTALVSVTSVSIDVQGSILSMKAPKFAVPNFQKPLEVGDEIFICEPGVEDNVKMRFDIALCEPEIIKGKPIGPTLVQLVKHVNSTVVIFIPMLG